MQLKDKIKCVEYWKMINVHLNIYIYKIKNLDFKKIKIILILHIFLNKLIMHFDKYNYKL